MVNWTDKIYWLQEPDQPNFFLSKSRIVTFFASKLEHFIVLCIFSTCNKHRHSSLRAKMGTWRKTKFGIIVIWSYLWIILTPKLLVWLAKFWTTETRSVTDLLRRMVTNFDVFFKRNGSTFRSTIFDVRDFVAFDVVNVFDDDLRLGDATATLVDESTSCDVATNDSLSRDNISDIWR